jgi:hypothetical protein
MNNWKINGEIRLWPPGELKDNSEWVRVWVISEWCHCSGKFEIWL